MAFSDVILLLKEPLLKVEEEIRKNYRSDIKLIPGLSGYLMNGGGKRFRPLLLLLCTKLCGYELESRAVKHACAIEYIHAATLLHDDVVDATKLRRGMETVNSKWGSDASILVGDFLISQSILLIADDTDQRTIQVIAKAAKTLVEGQILEFTHSRILDITEEHYLDVIYRKTASIISVSCQLGGILANADKPAEDALVAFGNDLGMAFQLVDDAMDYDGTEELLGKPVGTDFKEGNVTLPLLYLYRNAEPSLKKEIEGFVKNGNVGQGELDYIIRHMREAKAIDYTLDKARNYIEQGKAKLDRGHFKSMEYLDALMAVADNIVDRHFAGKSATDQG